MTRNAACRYCRSEKHGSLDHAQASKMEVGVVLDRKTDTLKSIATKAIRARAALGQVAEAVIVVRGDDIKAFNSALADLRADLDGILGLCPDTASDDFAERERRNFSDNPSDHMEVKRDE